MHPNRVLDFDVLIYVVSGSVQVVEDDQEYCILPGELLFLKHGCHHYGTKRNPPMTSWYYFHFYLPEITAQTRFDPFESFTYARSLNKENHSFFYQSKTINELIHVLHQYITNNETFYQKYQSIPKKQTNMRELLLYMATIHQ